MLGDVTAKSDTKDQVKVSKVKMTSPVTKVMKQTRLPFAKKIDNPPIIVEKPAVKKRKLSDDVTVVKSAKQPRNADDSFSKPLKSQAIRKPGSENVIVVIDDNEVSSSSEAEHVGHATKPEHKVSKQNVCLIDKFVQPISVTEKKISSTTEDEALINGKSVESTTDIADEDDDDDIMEVEHVEKKESTTEEVVKSASENESPDIVLPNTLVEAGPTPVLALTKCDGESNDLDKEVTADLDKSSVSLNDSINDSANDSLNDSLNQSTSSETSTTAKDENETGKLKESSATKSAEKRKKSPGALLKKAEQEAERQRKREEKESLKAEKQAQKEAEKREKERLKQEEKDRKDKEKEEAKAAKEKERLEKQNKLEQERQEKQRLKDEERQKKEAIQQQKLEEKKKKEAEKLEREEAKRKEEEEKERKKNSQKNALFKFFTKVEKPKTPPPSTENTGRFMAFEMKEGMILAPPTRVPVPNTAILDTHLQSQSETVLYLDELRSGKRQKRSSKKTVPDAKQTDDIEVVEDEAEIKKNWMKAKLLQFDKSETIRPAYYGTWRKTSRKISPRNPLKKDEVLLDYEVESDEEWEEEVPGESLSNSEGEDEDDPDNPDNNIEDDEDDGFFVPHGYLSDDEGADEEEESHEAKKARQKAKAHDWETQMKRKCQTVKAVVIGCLWMANGEQNPESALLQKLLQYKVKCLQPGPFNTTFTASKTDEAAATRTKKEKKSKGLKRGVPEGALPDLIRLVHGSPHGSVKLVREFKEFWRLKMGGQPLTAKTEGNGENESAADSADPNASTTSIDVLPGTPTCETAENEQESPKGEHFISKRQLEMTIRNIAVYEKREGVKKSHWYVNQEILVKHNLADLPVPCEWQYIVIKPAVKKEKKLNTSVTSSTQGTPKTPGRATPSIKQFTVGVSPGQMEAMWEAAAKSVPVASTPVSSKSAAQTPKAQPHGMKSITDFVRTVQPNKLFTVNNPSPPKGTTNESRENQPVAMETEDCTIVEPLAVKPQVPVVSVPSKATESDDDCMIIE